MSDETTQSGWSSPPPPDTAAPSPDAPAGGRAGFCQDCGITLTPTTARHVGSAIFCEPCLTSRVEATSSAYTTVPPSGIPPQAAAVPDEPSPALAAILGFIPGVGAMYNGQFAKGIVHLIIFAVLVSLSDINGIFGLFIAGWIFYMVFEAYHTAVARRDGLPLPNAFGFNDIGERMGFGSPFSGNTSPRPSTPPYPAQNAAPPPHPAPNPASTYAPAGTTPFNPVPVGPAPDWVGYVPPTAFAAAPPDPAANMAAQIHTQAMREAGYHVPYAETYTGAPASPYATSDLPPEFAASRFPTGALWLIGLGVLILVGNLLPDWKLTERWWPPLLFAGLALWTLTRRLRSGTRTVCIMRWPIILMVIAVMLALHAAYFNVTFGLTVSILLILFGLLLLLERTVGSMPVNPPPHAASPANPPFDPQSEQARARTSWAASSPSSVQSDEETSSGSSKDGL